MVLLAVNESLRDASCWRVLVMKGGAGVLLTSRLRTCPTAKDALSSSSMSSNAADSSAISNLSSFLPFFAVRVAEKGS